IWIVVTENTIGTRRQAEESLHRVVTSQAARLVSTRSRRYIVVGNGETVLHQRASITRLALVCRAHAFPGDVRDAAASVLNQVLGCDHSGAPVVRADKIRLQVIKMPVYQDKRFPLFR